MNEQGYSNKSCIISAGHKFVMDTGGRDFDQKMNEFVLKILND